MKAKIWIKDGKKTLTISMRGITVEEFATELLGMDMSKVMAVECKYMHKLNYLLGKGGSDYAYGK